MVGALGRLTKRLPTLHLSFIVVTIFRPGRPHRVYLHSLYRALVRRIHLLKPNKLGESWSGTLPRQGTYMLRYLESGEREVFRYS